MTEDELKNLKEALARNLVSDIDRVIKAKNIDAKHLSSSCPASYSDGKLHIKLLVKQTGSNVNVITNISFSSTDALFDKERYNDIDRWAGIKDKDLDPLTRARLRVMRDIFSICQNVSNRWCKASTTGEELFADVDRDGIVYYHN